MDKKGLTKEGMTPYIQKLRAYYSTHCAIIEAIALNMAVKGKERKVTVQV